MAEEGNGKRWGAFSFLPRCHRSPFSLPLPLALYSADQLCAHRVKTLATRTSSISPCL